MDKLIFFIALLAGSSQLFAAPVQQGNVRLELTPPHPVVGDTVSVHVLADSVPDIYGIEADVSFSRPGLSLVDEDAERPRTQIRPGTFWGETAPFILQNEGDNGSGEFRLAWSLVAPAEPVSGKGELLVARFRTEQPGTQKITLRKVRFGDTDGVLYQPALEGQPFNFEVYETPSAIPAPGRPDWVIWAGVGLLIVIALVTGMMLGRKRP